MRNFWGAVILVLKKFFEITVDNVFSKAIEKYLAQTKTNR